MELLDESTGRVVGAVWGTGWLAVGTGLCIVAADILDALPASLERQLVDVVPWLVHAPSWTAGTAIFPAVFGVGGFLYGTYELIAALTLRNHSIGPP